MKGTFLKVLKAAVVLAAGVGAVAAHAAGTAPDLSGMTAQVDWSTAIAAILAISGGLAGVFVVVGAAKLVIARIKGA